MWNEVALSAAAPTRRRAVVWLLASAMTLRMAMLGALAKPIRRTGYDRAYGIGSTYDAQHKFSLFQCARQIALRNSLEIQSKHSKTLKVLDDRRKMLRAIGK